MNFIKVKSYDELSAKAASIICAQVVLKPDSILGLATGSSPVGTYKKIIEKCAAGEVDFSHVRTVNLDEYVGLDGSQEQSYRYFMDTNLFDHINIDKKNTRVPCGIAEDLAKECADYDAYIKSIGGTDLQVLGIGVDGHIGFNEPDDHFTLATRVADLDESTIDANARFFASRDEVPRQAITMGIGAIMSAKKIVLVANGKAKKEIVEKAFTGTITPQITASILQVHPDCTVIYSEE